VVRSVCFCQKVSSTLFSGRFCPPTKSHNTLNCHYRLDCFFPAPERTPLCFFVILRCLPNSQIPRHRRPPPCPFRPSPASALPLHAVPDHLHARRLEPPTRRQHPCAARLPRHSAAAATPSATWAGAQKLGGARRRERAAGARKLRAMPSSFCRGTGALKL
jgi:hypothetical protein